MFDDLVAKGWVRQARTPDGLNLYKYRKRIFFKNLWKQDERLLEARGIILDDDGKIVQMAFRKAFNFGENNALVPRDQQVLAVRKINGFLGVATHHKGQLLISTTGSTTSEYVVRARKYLDKPPILGLLGRHPSQSFMFEIVDSAEDPHIVPEIDGAYLIGCRDKVLGSPLWPEAVLDSLIKQDPALAAVVMRPETIQDSFDSVRQRLKACKHEGFMIRSHPDGAVLCKLKSPHYLSKKALMRMGADRVEQMWKRSEDFKRSLDEEFFVFFDWLLANYTTNSWKQLRDFERRSVIETFFNNQAT